MAQHAWRGITVPTRGPKVIRRLFEIFNEERAPINATSHASGVGEKTISDWRYTGNARLDTFEAVLNTLGYELRICRMGE